MQIHPPEIFNDVFYHTLVKTIQCNDEINYALEIGSSTGEGSTAAFFEGLKNKPNKKLICIEGYKPAFDQLRKKYEREDWIECLNVFSDSEFMSDDEIVQYFKSTTKSYNLPYDIHFCINWVKEIEQYRIDNDISNDGIKRAILNNGIPDIVLIDGSPFTGYQEYNLLKEVKHIFIDDIDDIKCFKVWKELESNPNYALRWIDTQLRNGGAYYEKIN